MFREAHGQQPEDFCSRIMSTTVHETVLIGICDGAIDKKKNTSYFTNKIGDSPDLHPIITLQHPMCTLCQRGLSHVVQVYCPLAASLYHRTINIFTCANPQCYGKSESWIVLRSQCLDEEIKALSGSQDDKSTLCKESAMSRTDWCDKADDWGMDDEEQDTIAESSAQTSADTVQMQTDSINDGMDVSRKLEGLCIDGGVDHKSTLQPSEMPIFQPFYISVMEETDLDGFHDTDHEKNLLREYEEREGVIVGEIRSCESAEAPEEYEKAKAKHGDEVFTRFMKKISLCPEQVLRWSGSPLFIMEPPSNFNQMVPCCGNCGSPRIFEFQLMPALVSLLCSADINSETALEFGTVLVYTCRNSCWKSGSTVPVEEFLFVQPDPDQMLFK
ncbi:programmed cell death protein 2-like isoform X2 [Myxocyprinus asiaticus]|uniref:programmed cell death protein 2-like isoform X2 n=1 Tax=Myxocyprinus asiaticus TaxID=70543 RepID=UPI00222235C2|nr:programmed cell death protein 2-like isoform X2 [Myxocyprinus asiaticus]